ncbi:transporter substrate-binding domain-containing protein [Undibacterium sp. CY7W]|uniref:Transporter substrate-binding domain-containing protein n=1 Tax=Undibacterium rugosum TaxID=2762291 RepID=A0A923I5F6_9BURK|nr:ABC transporter substrate-binding protein [Undibacterium rugosum]MBC3933913.1 transporter substrate-binding domain-containing protein [Undibacterium rugosum]
MSSDYNQSMGISSFSLLILRLTLIALLGFSGHARSAELTIVTEHLPPLNYEEQGEVTGYSTEIVNAVMRNANLQVPIHVLPWARAYQLALTQANTLIFSITRTKERESDFVWIGPVSPRQIHLYKLKSRKDIQVRSPTDMRSYKLGLVREMASSKELVKQYAIEDKYIDYAPTVDSNMKKFLVGRVDLVVSQDWSAAYLMKTLGRHPDELESVLLLDNKHQYYLAMQKDSDPVLVQRIRQSFEKVQQSGLIEKLRIKYMR